MLFFYKYRSKSIYFLIFLIQFWNKKHKDQKVKSCFYQGLLSCVRHCADLVTSTERQEPIQKCFRSLEFIFKFIIQSRQLFARATQGNSFTLIDILDMFLDL